MIVEEKSTRYISRMQFINYISIQT